MKDVALSFAVCFALLALSFFVYVVIPWCFEKLTGGKH
jgi:hypothetical protein